MSTQVVVIGAGPGGYAAAFYAADRGLKVTLVDPEPNPGGVCLYPAASRRRRSSTWPT
jgi:dihydrolipoamide dehydrogenase